MTYPQHLKLLCIKPDQELKMLKMIFAKITRTAQGVKDLERMWCVLYHNNPMLLEIQNGKVFFI